MSAPLLSVVLPVRDVDPYLGTMLESLRHNQRRDFEVVVVDDGSTDRTRFVLDEHRRWLPRMTVLRNERAVGLADARNQGVAASSGRYVTFADGDDWLAPGYLARLVDAAVDLGTDFVRVDHVRFTGHRRELVRAPEGRRGTALEPRSAIGPAWRTSLVDYPMAWAGVYHRRLVEQGLLAFPAGLHTAEDRPWIWRLHLHARSCAVVSLAGYHYRREVEGSLTTIGDERQLHYLTAFALVLAEVRQLDQPQPWLTKAVRSYLAVVAHHLREEDRLQPGLRRRHRASVRAAMDAVPGDLVDRAIGAIGGERAELLRRARRRPTWMPL